MYLWDIALSASCNDSVDMPHVIVEVHIDKTKGFCHVQWTGKGVAVYQVIHFFRLNAVDIGPGFFAGIIPAAQKVFQCKPAVGFHTYELAGEGEWFQAGLYINEKVRWYDYFHVNCTAALLLHPVS